MNYPTPEEILAVEPRELAFFTERLQHWRTKHFKGWKNLTTEEKMEALISLINTMCEGEPPSIDPFYGKYGYIADQNILLLDQSNPSILSTLHEIGHCHFGRSELEACRFSVWLFRAVFPKSYAKLRWEGHLLVRK